MDLIETFPTAALILNSLPSHSLRSPQLTCPPDHTDSSCSLFQNPWALSDTTLSTSTTYWPAFSTGLNLFTLLTNPVISLEHVHKYKIHPHPPVKVINPDWGHSTSTMASSGPNLIAMWLGLTVCPGSTSHGDLCHILFDPIFSDCVGPFPWLCIWRHLPPHTLKGLPEFQLMVYSHKQCIVHLAILIPSNIIDLAMTTSTSWCCNKYMTYQANMYTF